MHHTAQPAGKTCSHSWLYKEHHTLFAGLSSTCSLSSRRCLSSLRNQLLRICSVAAVLCLIVYGGRPHDMASFHQQTSDGIRHMPAGRVFCTIFRPTAACMLQCCSWLQCQAVIPSNSFGICMCCAMNDDLKPLVMPRCVIGPAQNLLCEDGPTCLCDC